jgi:hypothetical protein
MRSTLLALTILAVAASPAAAGTPGHWTRVTPTTGVNIDQVTLLRGTDGVLHVGWLAKNAADPAKQDIATAAVTPSGAVGAAVPVETGWAGVSNPALVAAPAGVLRIFFGGIRTTDAGETQTNLSTSTAPAAGSPWTLQSGNVAEGGAAYASPVSAAALGDGTPLVSWGSSTGVFVHRGLSPGSGDPDYQAPLGGCCGYDTGLAVDGASGAPIVAWYSNATGHEGVYAQGVDPATAAPVGSAQLMPGSVTGGNSSQQLARTPIAARPGKPGVYVAYPGGYPTQDRVLLWKVGAGASTTLAKGGGDHRAVTLAAAPDGRIWVLWSQRVNDAPRVLARRSNAAVSKFGATVSIAPPPGGDSIWKLDASAQAGVLDVLGSFSTPGSLATWHSQIRPGLTIERSKSGQTVKVRVLDAGDPVAGAHVTISGDSGTTATNGRVTLTLKKGAKLKVTATKTGYTKATS